MIESEATPGGCWAHCSAVLVDGYRTLAAGQSVHFVFELTDQDGYAFRAVEAWPVGQPPVRPPDPQGPSQGPSPARRSAWGLTFEADPGRTR